MEGRPLHAVSLIGYHPRVRRVLALLPAAAAACSLSLDGFTGGAEAPDAGSDASDAASQDAQPMPDAAGADAAEAGGGWIPCRQRTASAALLFCDDFDDPGEQIGAKWKDFTQGMIGAVQTALSPPTAMNATVPALTTTYGFAKIGVSPTIPIAAAAVTWRFGVRVESLGARPNGYLSLGSMHFTASSCPTQGSETNRRVEITTGLDGTLYLFVVGLGAECNMTGKDDTVGLASMTSVAGPPRWIPIALRAAKAPCPGQTGGSSLALFAGGMLTACASVAVDPLTKTSAFQLHLGISDGMPWDTASLDYDDVELVTE